MRATLAVIVTLLALPSAYAQQQPTAAQTALAINQAVTNMAMGLDAAQHQIAQLQAENANLKRQLEEKQPKH